MKTLILSLVLATSTNAFAQAQAKHDTHEIASLKAHLDATLADARATRARLKDARHKASEARKAMRAKAKAARAAAKREREIASEDMQDD